MIRAEIKNLLMDIIRKKYGNIGIPDFSVEVPENPEHGDYATNAALVLVKILKKSPMDIAAAIARAFSIQHSAFSIKVAPPGFINFYLSERVLYQGVEEILRKKEKYGATAKKKEKVQVEFISANPTGPLHIGHGRGAFLGDALVRLLSFYGYRAEREFYINDAKTSAQIKELGKTALGRGGAYLTSPLKKKIFKLRGKLKKLEEPEAGYLLAKEIQKDNRRFIENNLKIKFNSWLSEESLYKEGWTKKVADLLAKENGVYEKDSALWLKTTSAGDAEDRVIIRRTGEPTYFYSDLAAHLNKLSRGFEKIMYIWGADHHGHVARTRYALKLLRVDERKFDFIITQVVRLVRRGKEVKMSKRRGQYVTLEELVKEVGLDATRYFFLEKSPDTHMDFDLGLAKERSMKNPVYYVQYAYARIASILRKTQNTKHKVQTKHKAQSTKLLNTPEELSLIKKLIQFTGVVEDTANDYQVHRLTRYAYELARSFHNFYEKQRVISEDKALTQARLALVKATQIVLRSTLDLLGISAPRRM